MSVYKTTKTIRNKTRTKKRTAGNKLPCAEAQKTMWKRVFYIVITL